jgi:hypothetical protein
MVSMISVTFDVVSKAMNLFLNGQVASRFFNNDFFGLNISNFVVGLGYSGRVDDVVILPYVVDSGDLLYQYPSFGLDTRAVSLQLGVDMQVSVKIRGVKRVEVGLGSKEFGLLHNYSQISFSKTGSELFDFRIIRQNDFISLGGISGAATTSGCRNQSTLTCKFGQADVLAFPGSNAAFLRVDFSSGKSFILPVSLHSSILSLYHLDSTGRQPHSSRIFSSEIIWLVNVSSIDTVSSHFAVLHGMNNMVVFPCSLIPGSSLLCNSSLIRRISTTRDDKQVLWKPFLDEAVYFSVISIGSTYQHISVGFHGESLAPSTLVISRILSFSVFSSSEDASYGVVVKYSELDVSVFLVFQDHPSPRILEIESPGISSSCLSRSFVSQLYGTIEF